MIKYVIRNFKLVSKDSCDNIDGNYIMGLDQSNINLYKISIYEWLYNIKFNLLEKILLEEIIKMLDDVLENRMEAFKCISLKLNINTFKIYELLENISKILVISNKVRINKDGRAIIKGYE